MPEFTMPGGHLPKFRVLDSMTQGYVEAIFFTETANEPSLEDANFAELAACTLAEIKSACRQFRKRNARLIAAALAAHPNMTERQLGTDFWFTRIGSGAGFADGDWSKPYATELLLAALKFSETSMYRGDNGKLYLYG